MIHEVAALLNISTDAIRLYEKEGLVTPTRNPENGYRYYNTEQIHRIMGICLYRRLHVSIARALVGKPEILILECLHWKISPMVFPVSLIPAKKRLRVSHLKWSRCPI